MPPLPPSPTPPVVSVEATLSIWQLKAASILSRINTGNTADMDELRRVVAAPPSGGWLQQIMALLQSLFGGFLSGLCPVPTPNMLHQRLTSTSFSLDDRPVSLEDRRQRRQLERSVMSRFSPDVAEYVANATWDEKMALTVSDCAAMLNSRV